MPDNRADENSSTQPELDAAIRRHFAEARTLHAVPDFESVMARAEAADAVAIPNDWLLRLLHGWSSPVRWAAAAALAAVLALAVLVSLPRDEDQASKEAALIAYHEQMRAAADLRLLAHLESTTRWQAPSDRWLAVESDIDIFGLPDIGSPEFLEEESTWL